MRQKKYLEELGDKVDRSLVKDQKSYKFIAEAAEKYKGKIALICLGPLSNLALAYHYDNSIVDYFTDVEIPWWDFISTSQLNSMLDLIQKQVTLSSRSLKGSS